MKQNNYLRVNWIDGMKINKNHFIELENAFVQLSRDHTAVGLNQVNFGLLPKSDAEEAIDLKLSMDGQDTIIVQLNKCKAVTAGGYVINITKEIASELENVGHLIKAEYNFDKSETECYVVLSVNPYVRVPVGDSDPQEEPPRHPFVLPSYQISIIPSSDINQKEYGLHHITIGRIHIDDGAPTLAEDFIPPCTSIQSHQDLQYVFGEIHTFFNAMEKYAMNITQKIFQKKQSNELAKMTFTICQGMLQYISSMLPEFRLRDKYAPPIVMVTRLMSLARIIKNGMDVYVGTGKEELLNYLSDWADLNQGAFENILIEMIEIEYQHTDLNKALAKIASFTKLMMLLFKKLNELDYIGKKSDANIFVKEEVVAKEEVKSRRSFLLD
ncbi:hypothetical protein ACFQ1M_11615 [Sungkyunkwania multivorans]|uniref:Type VI secretion, VC_A0110, EvfL, ImpJ, VasE n=1 Tax=Sungkyunkwania multivorans TaxID=1173618 RepID=A0ABW3CYK7_9FLAO